MAVLAPWRLPAGVSREVAVDDGGRIVLLGGLAVGDVSSDGVWGLAPATGAATRIGSLVRAVHDAAGTVEGTEVLVFGGGSFSTVGTVQAWSSPQGARTVGELPTPRSDLAAARIGDTSYVVGGFDGSSMQPTILATTDGRSFTAVGELAVGVRYPAVVAAGGVLWIVGGQLGTSESSSVGGQTDDIERFDPATGRTAVVGHLPEVVGHASAFVLGGRLFVAGGVVGTTHSAWIWEIDLSTGSATVVGSLPGPRSDAPAVVVGTTAYLVGGEATGPTAPLDSVVEITLGPGSP